MFLVKNFSDFYSIIQTQQHKEGKPNSEIEKQYVNNVDSMIGLTCQTISLVVGALFSACTISKLPRQFSIGFSFKTLLVAVAIRELYIFGDNTFKNAISNSDFRIYTKFKELINDITKSDSNTFTGTYFKNSLLVLPIINLINKLLSQKTNPNYTSTTDYSGHSTDSYI